LSFSENGPGGAESVLQRLDARYMPGVRTSDWRKVKSAA